MNKIQRFSSYHSIESRKITVNLYEIYSWLLSWLPWFVQLWRVKFGGFSVISPYLYPPLFLTAIIKPAESAFGVLTGYEENEDYDF